MADRNEELWGIYMADFLLSECVLLQLIFALHFRLRSITGVLCLIVDEMTVGSGNIFLPAHFVISSWVMVMQQTNKKSDFDSDLRFLF